MFCLVEISFVKFFGSQKERNFLIDFVELRSGIRHFIDGAQSSFKIA